MSANEPNKIAELMVASLLVRRAVPTELTEKVDLLTEAALREAFRDELPLSELVLLHGGRDAS